MEKNGPNEFFALHESIRKEYSGNNEVIVKEADIIFSGELLFDLGDLRIKVMQTEAPHTDDSTIVYVCEDKTLFLGDATGHEFFTGIKEEHLCRKLYDTIKHINPEICVEGHWMPVDKEDTLSDLMS